MAEPLVAPAHQFDDLEQQREASELGIWVFLCTEVLLFGGLFTVYTAYRFYYPQAFAHASQTLDLRLGGINTVVLIGSSLTMALAVYAARVGARRMLVRCLGLTAFLGAVFLGIKGIEWAHKFHEGHVPGIHYTVTGPEAGPQALFYFLYFMMTGIHALHLIIGIVLVLVVLVLGRRGRFTPSYYHPVEITGLYWHFVDIVWIFLLPILYLIDRHGPS